MLSVGVISCHVYCLQRNICRDSYQKLVTLHRVLLLFLDYLDFSSSVIEGSINNAVPANVVLLLIVLFLPNPGHATGTV